ncbi:hypothetical protein D3C72_1415450 [compost metagenome]
MAIESRILTAWMAIFFVFLTMLPVILENARELYPKRECRGDDAACHLDTQGGEI